MTLTPAQLRQARAMSEADLQSRVRSMCDSLGLAVEHVENSLQGRTWLPGMPDLTIFGHVILYRELKDEVKDLSPKQRRVRGIIIAAGGNWGLWRPRDLISGQIATELTSISRLPIARCITPDFTERTGYG